MTMGRRKWGIKEMKEMNEEVLNPKPELLLLFAKSDCWAFCQPEDFFFSFSFLSSLFSLWPEIELYFESDEAMMNHLVFPLSE